MVRTPLSIQSTHHWDAQRLRRVAQIAIERRQHERGRSSRAVESPLGCGQVNAVVAAAAQIAPHAHQRAERALRRRRSCATQPSPYRAREPGACARLPRAAPCAPRAPAPPASPRKRSDACTPVPLSGRTRIFLANRPPPDKASAAPRCPDKRSIATHPVDEFIGGPGGHHDRRLRARNRIPVARTNPRLGAQPRDRIHRRFRTARIRAHEPAH